MVYLVLIAIFQDFSHSLCIHVISFPEIMGSLVTSQNGKFSCKMGNICGTFTWPAIKSSICYHMVMLRYLVIFTWTAQEDLFQGWDVTVSDCQRTLPGANTSNIFVKESAEKDQGFRKPVWFTLNSSWAGMGSVSTLMVKGLVLSAVVDLLPQVP